MNDFPNDESQLHPCMADSTVTQLAEANETMTHIKQAVTELPAQQKQVFILRHYQHLPLKEIAELLGVKTGTVKAHLFYAIRNLQQLLADHVQV